MTAFAFQEDKKNCFDAGMDDYLSKPVRLDDLIKMLNKYSFGAKKKEMTGAEKDFKELERETNLLTRDLVAFLDSKK